MFIMEYIKIEKKLMRGTSNWCREKKDIGVRFHLMRLLKLALK